MRRSRNFYLECEVKFDDCQTVLKLKIGDELDEKPDSKIETIRYSFVSKCVTIEYTQKKGDVTKEGKIRFFGVLMFVGECVLQERRLI